MSSLFDPEAVACYAEGTSRLVPGYADLQRMTALPLAERLVEDRRVLVLGASGRLELKTFAERQPRWTVAGFYPLIRASR